MKLENKVLKLILDAPGTSKEKLRSLFDLTEYRLKRILRHIEADLPGATLVHHLENGVWIVQIDPAKCLGVDWMGTLRRGYVQCSRRPRFSDGRCWHHSRWEDPEMIAFERRLGYLSGPCEPSPYSLSQLTIIELEELIQALKDIVPKTLMDRNRKNKFMAMLLPALAILRWKDRMRRRRVGHWASPEFAERHRRSSVNLFEFSLRQHFQVLELSSDSTREDVLKAWKKLAKRYHPDTSDGDEEKMKAINSAKERIFKIRGWD